MSCLGYEKKKISMLINHNVHVDSNVSKFFFISECLLLGDPCFWLFILVYLVGWYISIVYDPDFFSRSLSLFIVLFFFTLQILDFLVMSSFVVVVVFLVQFFVWLVWFGLFSTTTIIATFHNKQERKGEKKRLVFCYCSFFYFLGCQLDFFFHSGTNCVCVCIQTFLFWLLLLLYSTYKFQKQKLW